MHRILIALLAAFDAIVAALVGLAVVLAPLTLLWIFTLGVSADWAGLWPATARIWELGNLVPLSLSLDDDARLALGLPDEAAAFALTLAPWAFAAFAAVFAARSGARAVRSGSGIAGVAAGTAMTAGIAALVLVTSGNDVAGVVPWQAVLLPTAVYGAGALAGAWAEAWSEGDGGVVDALHERVDGWSSAWREVPSLAVRGGTIAVAGIVGSAALALLVAVFVRADAVIGLFEQAQVDLLGAAAVALAQVAYLPTLLGWAVSWVAGPGFAMGTSTSISPAGTQVGAVPGVPLLGLLPEQGSGWLLLVALLPVAAGAAAGWHARAVLAAEWEADPPRHDEHPHEPVLPRIVVAVATAVLAGAVAALMAALSSGSMGPGRLAEVGPDPGAIALAVGLEVLLGAAILLLAPVRGRSAAPEPAADGGALARR